MRARGFFLSLGLGLAGWVVFLGFAMAARLPAPGIGRVLAAQYHVLFFAFAIYLMALTPFLVGTSTFYVWRGELSAVASTAVLLGFLGGSLLLLRLLSPLPVG
jgi:hypothetical protein